MTVNYSFDARTALSPEELNQRFSSINARLKDLERIKADLEALQVALRAEGVTRLTEYLQQEIPPIISDAQSGMLTGLADESIPLQKLDLTNADASSFGAEHTGAVAIHEAANNIHSMASVAGLQTALSGKQPLSTLLSDIAAEVPLENSVLVGTGTTWEGLLMEAGDSIAFSFVDGKFRIDATGSASGESNSGASLGTGHPVYSGKVGTDLQFKTLVPAAPLTISDNGDTLGFGLDQSGLTLSISQITNLQPSLDSKQDSNALLSEIAALTPAEHEIPRFTASGIETVGLVGGANITITHTASGIEFAAATSSFSVANVGSTGAAVYKGMSGDTAQFRKIDSLVSYLIVNQATNRIELDFDSGAYINSLSTGAIAWDTVDKSGATPADIGAEVAGAVTTHEASSNAHGIGDINGLWTELAAKFNKASSSAQSLDTSIFVAEDSLTGGTPTPDVGSANYFYVNITQNVTIQNPINIPAGTQVITFTLQENNGGGHSISWGSNYYWGENGEPIWATGSGKITIVSFLQRDGNLFYLGHVTHN